jgi:hypothetical protein
MSGIYKKLFDLLNRSSGRPLEDFLTEIFAYVIKNDQLLLQDFLSYFNILSDDVDDLTVITQFELKALPAHEVDSRPDIAIFGEEAAILIENKLNALEGASQLSRYAEHLENFHKKKSKLVYITRDFDQKNASEIFSNCSLLSQQDFIQIRWFEVALFLKQDQYEDNTHVKELLYFMKQIRITMNHQFTPINILTLSNFSNVRQLMDEILLEEIYSRFKQVSGDATQHSTCLTQLKSHDRYVYYSKQKDKINILLGFWMNSENEKEYPEFGIQIELNPSSKKNKEWRESFRRISELHQGWEPYNLDNPNAWCGVSKKDSLQQIISEDNHILKVKTLLNDWITELEEIIREFSIRA